MTLALELGGIHDPAIQRAFQVLAQQFPVPVATGGGGGAPSGPAGGDLTGTYPNPGIAALVIVDGDISASAAIARAKLDFGSGLVNADIAAAAAIAESKLSLATDAAAGVGSRRTLGTGALQATAGNDSRLSDSRAPNGSASGDLTGSYPGPTIAALAVTDAKVAAANKDGLAAVASMRTLGTGATQAAAGNDSRLSDSRAPNGTAGGDLTGTYPNPTIAALAVTDAKTAAANKDGTAGTPSMRTLGTGAAQACAGNDSRLSDARTPTAHQSTHQSGNSDALTGNVDATARHNILKAGSVVGTRRGINLVAGTNITLTMADNAGSERVDVTIDAAGGGGAATTFLNMAKWGVD